MEGADVRGIEGLFYLYWDLGGYQSFKIGASWQKDLWTNKCESIKNLISKAGGKVSNENTRGEKHQNCDFLGQSFSKSWISNTSVSRRRCHRPHHFNTLVQIVLFFTLLFFDSFILKYGRDRIVFQNKYCGFDAI